MPFVLFGAFLYCLSFVFNPFSYPFLYLYELIFNLLSLFSSLVFKDLTLEYTIIFVM